VDGAHEVSFGSVTIAERSWCRVNRSRTAAAGSWGRHADSFGESSGATNSTGVGDAESQGSGSGATRSSGGGRLVIGNLA